MELTDQIRKIAEGKLKSPAHFVVDVTVSLRGTQKVVIVVDGDQSLTIDDCADLSRDISKEVDELPSLKDSYMLEVTTPGLDQPLRLTRQYAKNIGRKLRVKMIDKTVEGKLTAVYGDKISIDVELSTGKKKETAPQDIKFSDIDKSFVLVSFK